MVIQKASMKFKNVVMFWSSVYRWLPHEKCYARKCVKTTEYILTLLKLLNVKENPETWYLLQQPHNVIGHFVVFVRVGEKDVVLYGSWIHIHSLQRYRWCYGQEKILAGLVYLVIVIGSENGNSRNMITVVSWILAVNQTYGQVPRQGVFFA